MKQNQYPRRRFIRDASLSAALTWISPNLLFGAVDADVMDDALERMAKLAPLTNHGPMAAEALVALGCKDRVIAFVEAYKKRFVSAYPASTQPISQKNWQEALGDAVRVADWANLFHRELQEKDWKEVLNHWCDALAPGLAAAAGHGLIRTAHAVRSLSRRRTDPRLRELAQGLAYWAAYYQTLPELEKPNQRIAATPKLKPAQAFYRIPLLPMERRANGGSIMIGLRSLHDFAPFSGVADLIDPSANSQQILSEATETFANAYVKNVTRQNFITLIHTVTATTALRSLLPFVSQETTRKLIRYGWQLAAGLYSIAGAGSVRTLEEEEIKRDNLIDRAVNLQEEHAIKFTEACLREYALNPKSVYLNAAADAVSRL
ncbi:questin oxidase family protein [bacterium]|nr:questin oxidase family protein [bacterium]MCI0607345.1 questin oxidase family protein [bacterium]